MDYRTGPEKELPWSEHVRVVSAGIEALEGPEIDIETANGLRWIHQHLLKTSADVSQLPVKAMAVIEFMIESQERKAKNEITSGVNRQVS